MSAIILPRTASWYNMCKPQPGEMETFLKRFKQPEFWRVPKIHWQQLWLENRGNMNGVLGRRVFRGPKFQRGMLGPIGFWHDPPAVGAAPALTDITNTYTNVAPTNSHQHIRYHTDGYMQLGEGATAAAAHAAYVQITTTTDDANDHTDEWWDAQPSTAEGANYDIRYTATTGTWTKIFHDGTADLVVNTWDLISAAYTDSLTAGNGCLRLAKPGGTAKSPNPGTNAATADIEIRLASSGSALATQTVDMTCTVT